MLSKDLLNIIEARIKQDLEDRRNLFRREIAQIKEDMVAKNSLYSGATVRLILDAIETEYRVRTAMIWQSFDCDQCESSWKPTFHFLIKKSVAFR